MDVSLKHDWSVAVSWVYFVKEEKCVDTFSREASEDPHIKNGLD